MSLAAAQDPGRADHRIHATMIAMKRPNPALTRRYPPVRALLSLALAVASSAALAEPFTPGRYELSSQTVMPNLDEMRHITATETRCLRSDPNALFPVLRQPALRGCSLVPAGAQDPYTLVCQTTLVASGTARIVVGTRRVTGDLQVKMGGKNMTFSQHVRATPLGPCTADDAAP